MNKLTLIASMVLVMSASAVLAGGGGEELPIAVPDARPAPKVVGATYECTNPAVNDVPTVYEMWKPETNWVRSEWQPRGWNPLNAEYITTVFATPDARCDSEWLEYDRSRKTQKN